MEFKSFQLDGVTMSIFLCTKGDIYWNIGILGVDTFSIKKYCNQKKISKSSIRLLIDNLISEKSPFGPEKIF